MLSEEMTRKASSRCALGMGQAILWMYLWGLLPQYQGWYMGVGGTKNSSRVRNNDQRSCLRAEVNLSEIEWVVIDEADVLFGTSVSVSICLPFYIFASNNFIDQMLLLLSHIGLFSIDIQTSDPTLVGSKSAVARFSIER
jgi:hypothetical protein